MKCLIGLGSNLGNPAENLEKAAQALFKISPRHFRISPVYHTSAVLPENASREWDLTFQNAVVEIEWTESPKELFALLKFLEKQIGRTDAPKWSPRIIDLDLLTFGTEMYETLELQIPHSRIQERSFVLDPMKDLNPNLILPGFRETVLAQARKLSHHQPLIMGVINLTPDSFSDGDVIKSETDFEELFKKMVLSGTQIIDIGAESTRPGATILSQEEEWQRLRPSLNFIKKYFANRLVKPLISLDTNKAEIVKRSLEYGVDIINDVSGIHDPGMLDVLKTTKCQYILMHNLGVPADPSKFLPENCDLVAVLKTWLQEKLALLEFNKIDLSRVIFDVGIGFGKDARQSLEILDRMYEFSDLPIRLMVGHSRKSFMKEISKVQSVEIPSTRDAITLSFSYKLAKQGVDILRVHDFSTHMEAFV